MCPDRWLGVELRHLAALAAIAGEGSFRGAADELGYVQSSVSEQLAMLEQVVGARLVERGPGTRPLSLTPAGALLVRHADDILGRVAAAKAEFGRVIGGADEMGATQAGPPSRRATTITTLWIQTRPDPNLGIGRTSVDGYKL